MSTSDLLKLTTILRVIITIPIGLMFIALFNKEINDHANLLYQKCRISYSFNIDFFHWIINNFLPIGIIVSFIFGMVILIITEFIISIIFKIPIESNTEIDDRLEKVSPLGKDYINYSHFKANHRLELSEMYFTIHLLFGSVGIILFFASFPKDTGLTILIFFLAMLVPINLLIESLSKTKKISPRVSLITRFIFPLLFILITTGLTAWVLCLKSWLIVLFSITLVLIAIHLRIQANKLMFVSNCHMSGKDETFNP